MTTAKAIMTLRQELGYTQRQFAEELGVTVVTVSRYENGREPTLVVLKKLTDLADSRGLDYLRDIFASKSRGDIVSRVKRLPSSGSARRVPAYQIELLRGRLHDVYQVATWILNDGRPLTLMQQRTVLRGIRSLTEKCWNEFEPYSDPKWKDGLNPDEKYEDYKNQLFGYLTEPIEGREWMHSWADKDNAEPRSIAPPLARSQSGKKK